MTIVVISVVMDSVQEMRAQNTVDALRRRVRCAPAVRRGQEVTVLVAELVPGDVAKLPADFRQHVGDLQLSPTDDSILLRLHVDGS